MRALSQLEDAMRSRSWIVLVVTVGLMPVVHAAETARAVLRGTAEGSPIRGTVTIQERPDGLRITASISETPPGPHGFHIHTDGSCDNGGKAAGGHYNPEGVQHGLWLNDGPSDAHAGDLGNLEVAADGSGSFDELLPALSLNGHPYAVAGRAVILHAQPDDFGQPTGNAGARIACGVIVINSQGSR